MTERTPVSETQEIMGREEIAARLRALADHSAPWKLSADPQVIWRVACRQAAAHFEALARLAPSATAALVNEETGRGQANGANPPSDKPSDTPIADAVNALRDKLERYESALQAATNSTGEESDQALLDTTRAELLEAIRPLLSTPSPQGTIK